uniref:Uncharacterized protein n=1 Tax=Cuerna arida TaxID=1464854 RepID=A0A1B6EZC5_9HEMI
MDQLDSAQKKQEVENTENVSENVNPEEDTCEMSVSNTGEEFPTSDLIDSPGEDRDNSGTTQTSTTDSSEEPQRSARNRRSIVDAPLLKCPAGQDRDFRGTCRRVL